MISRCVFISFLECKNGHLDLRIKLRPFVFLEIGHQYVNRRENFIGNDIPFVVDVLIIESGVAFDP